MKNRCLNPKNKGYINYGGRGIKICSRWLGREGFVNFVADTGRRLSSNLSLDRIDVNGDYEPSNCRWATKKEQGENRRKWQTLDKFSTEDLFNELRKRMNNLMNQKRDSKDPAPSKSNSERIGGGNDPAPGGEKVGSGKAERVSPASRFDSKKPGPEQPTRGVGGGNVPAGQAPESHGQSKAEHVKASQRF